MKWFKRILTGLVIFAFVAAGAIFLALRSCRRSMCGTEEMRRVASPDGKMEALAYDYSCGATDHYHTNLSIVRTGAKLPVDDDASVFEFDPFGLDIEGGKKSFEKSEAGGLTIIEWKSNSALLLRYPLRADIQKQLTEKDGIHIEYLKADN